MQQMARALLTPEITPTQASPGDTDQRPLDPSQEEAAHGPRGPLLLEAGPGTGKTRTLIGRIVFLLEQNVPPSSILALTFSNRAAEEMRSRVADANPEDASRIWIGTFHAFGLELLRKYGTHLGLPSRLSVLDPSDSIALLERRLSDLNLDHYQNLYDPALYLRDIMAAISRAKDELVGPEGYAALAERMLDQAATSDEIERAERAIEVPGGSTGRTRRPSTGRASLTSVISSPNPCLCSRRTPMCGTHCRAPIVTSWSMNIRM